MRYENVTPSGLAELQEALAHGDTSAAARAIIGISLHTEDLTEGVSACVEAVHADNEVVRGNAILGLGHLARRFRHLDRALVEPLIAGALQDGSEYVRGQAESAADDVAFFLGWHVNE